MSRVWRWVAGLTVVGLVASVVSVLSWGVAWAVGGRPVLPVAVFGVPGGGLPVGPAVGGGVLGGSWGVSSAGGASYTVPLDVPPGRAGMAPSVGLSYTSSQGDGSAGVGMSVSGLGSQISRCGKSLQVDGVKRGVNYDAEDRFCLDGQELVVVSGTYGAGGSEYRTAGDVFAKVEAKNYPVEGQPEASPATGPDRFEVRTRDGRVATYVAWSATGSQESVQTSSETSNPPANDKYTQVPNWAPVSEDLVSRRVGWELSTVADRFGNEMRYEYNAADFSSWVNPQSPGDPFGSERLLSKITYTWGAGFPAARSVEVVWEDRRNVDPVDASKFVTDYGLSFVSGVRFKQTKRIKEIRMWAPDPDQVKVVRTYKFDYQTMDPAAGVVRSRLAKLTMCGASGGCAVAKQFEWATPQTPSFASAQTVASFPLPAGDHEVPPGARTGDYNGDGAADLVFFESFLQCGNCAAPPDKVLMSKRDAAGVVAPLAESFTAGGQGDYPFNTTSIAETRPMDLEGDGKTDLSLAANKVSWKDPSNAAGGASSMYMFGRVLTWDAATHTFMTAHSFPEKETAWEDWGDANGDGRMDRFAAWLDPNANKFRVTLRLNMGGVQPLALGPQMVFPEVVNPHCAHQVSDTNGDGRAELLLERAVSQYPWSDECGRGSDVDAFGYDPSNSTLTVVRGGAKHQGLSPAPGGARTHPWLSPQRLYYVEGGVPGGDEHFNNELFPKKTFFGDFNADGLADTLVVGRDLNEQGLSQAAGPARILWNTGVGLRLDSGAASAAFGVPHDELLDVRIGDMNGDGRDDVVSFWNTDLQHDKPQVGDWSWIANGQDKVTVMLSRGDGSFQRNDMVAPAGMPRIEGRVFSQLADFTGDGRPDIMTHGGTNLTVMTQNTPLTDRVVSVSDENAAHPQIRVDYDTAWTDRADLIAQNTCGFPLVCVRSGMPVVRSVTVNDEMFDGTGAPYTLRYSYADPVTNARAGFVGFRVVRSWDEHAATETVSTYDHVKTLRAFNNGMSAASLTPFAATPTDVTTATLIDEVDWEQPPPSARARITRVRTETPEMRELNGGKSFVTYPTGSITETSETQVAVNWSPSLLGTQDVQHLSFDPATLAPFTTSRVELSEVVNGQIKAWFDDFGNPTKSVTRSGAGDITTTTTTTDVNAAVWLIGKPKHSEVTSSSATPGAPGAVTRTVDHVTDPVTGLPISTTTQKGTADEVTATVQRHATGGVTQQKVSAAGQPDRITHIEYLLAPGPGVPANGMPLNGPDERIFPVQTWVERGETAYQPSTWTVHHPAHGTVLASWVLTDAKSSPADLVSGTTHSAALIDDLGRVVKTTGDGVAPTEIAYAHHLDGNGKIIGTKVSTEVHTTPAPNITKNTTTVIADQLGRARKSTVTGFDGSAVVSTTGYDSLGRPSWVTRPNSNDKAVTTYDNLGRTLTATSPDGKVTGYAYPDPFTTVVTDADGHKSKSIVDASGRVVTSGAAHSGGQWAMGTVKYGPFDQPFESVDVDGNTTTTTYHATGAVKHVADPDRGATDYTYKPTGEIHTITHAGSGDVSTYHYDDLGRVTTVADLDAQANPPATTTTTYTWDTRDYGLGQPASTVSPDQITTLHHYDTLGRGIGTDYIHTAADSLCPAASPCSFRQTYDWAGRADTLTYPSAPGRPDMKIRNTYNQWGHPTTITDVSDPLAPATLAHITTANADLAPTQITRAPNNGLTQTNTYDPKTGRLDKTTTTSPVNNKTLQHLAYTYTDAGRVHTKTQNDEATGNTNRVNTYTYDDLARLHTDTLTNNGTSTTTTYTHTPGGNLLTTTNSTALSPTTTNTYPTPGQARPHAPTTATNPAGDGTETYHYDTHGRQTDITGPTNNTLRHTTYTPYNLPKTMTDKNNATTTFTYTAGGDRFTETGPLGTTLTINNLFEHRATPNNTHTWIYTIPGVGQAVHNGQTTTIDYTLTDPQGTPTATTTATGQLNNPGGLFHDAYGARTTQTGAPIPNNNQNPTTGGTNTHGYTGHQHNDNLRTINANGRIYDPTTKTFLTPDPIRSNHPYNYVNGDPTNRTDPTGYNDIPNGGYSDASDYYTNQQTPNYGPWATITPTPNEPITTCGGTDQKPCTNGTISDGNRYTGPGGNGGSGWNGNQIEGLEKAWNNSIGAALNSMLDGAQTIDNAITELINTPFYAPSVDATGAFLEREDGTLVGGPTTLAEQATAYTTIASATTGAAGAVATGTELAALANASRPWLAAAAAQTLPALIQAWPGKEGQSQAAIIMPGGQSNVIQAHSGTLTSASTYLVPPGTSVTTAQPGKQLLTIAGELMQQGDWDTIGKIMAGQEVDLSRTYLGAKYGATEVKALLPEIRESLEGMSTWLPGAKMPLTVVFPPKRLPVYFNVHTVKRVTMLPTILGPGMGNVVLAGCMHLCITR
ncbi:RHS repeat-associated core domain-containing protein [Actinokineospora sp. HUAS TT18]|uniref:RHS repeat-associated core domain-containing protein n=1 Tax=Actinokineospora sp. HUAS TT18 TaxID=3447451 RepID=UPI003F520256